ncbi:hypothetical protein IJJ37_00305 [Candidatus Saccharibacteria bacterium]|nr:hypothetical protein [Candidatus Saccharibacteria bacterium]
MSGMRDKLRKWKYRLKHDFLSVENVVLVVAVVMCFTWTFQSIEAMNRNWELTERLNKERRNLELITVEVETAELENEYLASDEYQELLARKLANKQLPGEHLVYLEENTDAAKNKHKIFEMPTEVKEVERSNPEKWFVYLFP